MQITYFEKEGKSVAKLLFLKTEIGFPYARTSPFPRTFFTNVPFQRTSPFQRPLFK